MPRSSRRNGAASLSQQSGSGRRNSVATAVTESDDDEDVQMSVEEDEEVGDETMAFSSQLPEMSQSLPPVRASDRRNLQQLNDEKRDKALNDTTRLILFKAFASEPIDRLKIAKEAGISDSKISSAAVEEVNIRLRNAFDFELRRLPVWMEKMKSLPKRFKDRYYLINSLEDTTEGKHSKAIHGVHGASAVENGFLMIVLALAYCKGEPRSDGSRWILDKDLYALLHRLDGNIHAAPPEAGVKRSNKKKDGEPGNHLDDERPEVDSLLEKFVQRDYLIKEKASEEFLNAQQLNAGEICFLYAMGPRAAMEIGRRQVIVFCAEILDEEPDPTMLNELDDDEEMEDDDEEGQ